MKRSMGKVYIVGAGPGDPGLITVKAMKLLQEAAVVVYDHLINPVLLSCAHKRTRLIDVGKQVGRKVLEQEEINALLVREAKSGKVVVRLKGGDPFIFGRGGEECETLAAHDIPFEIVPGVSSAIAAPAYAGIPLTHRACASSVALATGHEDPAKKAGAVDFKKLARSVDTVVCLMGVGTMGKIARDLMAGGLSPHTPVAVIEQGTYPYQRVVEGGLGNIAPRITRAGVKPPAVMVVGKVVKLRKRISWFDSRPLFEKTIMVTRARNQAHALVDLLEQAGARVICFPTITIAPPRSVRKLDRALRGLQEYHYVVFTSVNGVNTFVARMKTLGIARKVLRRVTMAALGEMTARALRAHGLSPAIVPDVFTSRHLAAAFKRENMRDKKVLLVRPDISGDLLPAALKKMGARVEEVSSYSIGKPRAKTGEVKNLFRQGQVDCITFTSPSTFSNFVSIMKGEPIKRLLQGTAVAAIGPVTSKEIMEHGVRVNITASPYTIPGLVDAIVAFYGKRGE